MMSGTVWTLTKWIKLYGSNQGKTWDTKSLVLRVVKIPSRHRPMEEYMQAQR